MKRFLMSILVSCVILLGWINVAQAQPLPSVPTFILAVEAAPTDVLEQLKTQFLPEIQNILTPEQQQQLETALVEGKSSLRKAFKSLTLTPDQKTKLASVFKTLPKKEVFTAMTPEQKRQLFMKKKELFMPTAEEIAAYKAMKGKE